MASILHLLRPAVDKGMGVLTSVDKGKGIVVEEEEGDKEADDEDSDDGSDVGSEVESGGEEDDDTDFVDDPLVEVVLENILPSRTLWREPPPPGVYFDPDQDEDDSGDSENPNVLATRSYRRLIEFGINCNEKWSSFGHEAEYRSWQRPCLIAVAFLGDVCNSALYGELFDDISLSLVPYGSMTWIRDQ
ncbi:hypothetical protein MUK42_15071 [Musa troglodytarum]|uniref:Uncharacterized protein n=1 Tax=Musa troglodytarum TaxID=320322 RepID=A0A9E7IA49_9LILI|nr:hypothetical protein MUK42_15071 [Musa troglodytarum]